MSLLTDYKKLLTLSDEMLILARSEQWDELADINERFNALSESVKTVDAPIDLSYDEAEEMREVLTRLLDNINTVRSLVEPEKGRVGHILGDVKREDKITKTYHATVSKS